MENITETLIDLVKMKIEKEGITKRELAKALHISESSIYKILNHHQKIDFDLGVALAFYLDIYPELFKTQRKSYNVIALLEISEEADRIKLLKILEVKK